VIQSSAVVSKTVTPNICRRVWRLAPSQQIEKDIRTGKLDHTLVGSFLNPGCDLFFASKKVLKAIGNNDTRQIARRNSDFV